MWFCLMAFSFYLYFTDRTQTLNQKLPHMGLDSVELIVKAEKAFGIVIPDQEAEKIITVADFHNTVWRYVQSRQSVRCKSQHVYYKLRHALIYKFGVNKSDIEPNASLNDIFPQTNRRLLYRKLAKELQLKLPKLVLPSAWAIILSATGMLLIPGAALFSLMLVYLFNFTKWVLLLPVIGLILTVFFSNILDAVRTVFNPATIKAYTQLVLSVNYATLTQENGASRKEVEVVINHIIANFTGFDVQEISPEMKIHEDIGID
jgi:acyl carrier protein